MDDDLIFDILSGGSKVLAHLTENIDILKDFLVLVNRIDALPETNRRLDSVSPYQAVAKGLPLQQIERYFIAFFGAPIKRAGDPVKLNIKLNPSVKYLGEIRTEQAFFILKTRHGEFYGAIWPWVRRPEFQTIHLGYYSKSMKDEDFQKLESLVKQSVHQRMVNDMEAGVGGILHGISLPAFLQMSEMETTTATLKVKSGSKTGHLYLVNGILLDAKTDQLSGINAAYEIISWDDVSIEIDKADHAKQKAIHEPLMHILMESLKIKDERNDIALNTDSPEAHSEDLGHSLKVTDAEDLLHKEPSEVTRIKKKKPGKMRIGKIIAVYVIVIITLATGAYLVNQQIEAHRIKKAYQSLLKNLDKQDSYKNKEILINLFINAHKDTAYSKKAEEKLAFFNRTMEEQLYKDIITAVEALPLTIDYDKLADTLNNEKAGQAAYERKIARAFYDEKMARALYEEYLVQFPEGRHVEEIKARISAIPEKIDDTHYQQLISTDWKDESEKIKACKGYIISQPKGKHRDEVEGILVNLLENHYSNIQKSLKVCDEKNHWAPCLEKCNRFLLLFDNTYRTDAVKEIKKYLQGKQDLADLKQAAQLKGEDYIGVKHLYQVYLKSHPDSTINDAVEEEIVRLQTMIDEKQAWQKVLDYAEDPKHNVDDKLNELNRFVAQNSTSRFVSHATAIFEKLQIEESQIQEKRIAEERQTQEQRRLILEAERQQKQKNRISGEITKTVSLFKMTGGRYRYNGDETFRDTKTGLAWCVLNSDVTIGGCLDYESALRYVKNLTTGGHTDWRLPTFSELSGLYKHKPFFPSAGQKKFWTSETILKGYHEMAGVVTSKQETVFQRDYILTKDCATVHAVRGKN